MSLVLYIIVRNDIQSMNSGKAMAQVSHATSLFTDNHSNSLLKEKKEQWKKQAGSYGTVLILSANISQINDIYNNNDCKKFIHGAMYDETYPYQTTSEIAKLIPVKIDTSDRIYIGDTVLLHRNELTCFYILGEKDQLKSLIGHLTLFK